MSFGGYGWLGTDEQIAQTSITRSYADHNILIERLLAIDEYARATRKHQFPHTPDKRESLRVSDEGILTGLPVGVIQISNWRHTRVPAILDFRFQSSLYVLA